MIQCIPARLQRSERLEAFFNNFRFASFRFEAKLKDTLPHPQHTHVLVGMACHIVGHIPHEAVFIIENEPFFMPTPLQLHIYYIPLNSRVQLLKHLLFMQI